jgi:hypothetical protein
MPDPIDRNIATIFLAVAEKAAEANRRGAVVHTHQSISDDFMREVRPLMHGIAALPEKDGVVFKYQNRVSCETPVHNVIEMVSPAGSQSFTIRAMPIVRGGLYISIGYGAFDGKSNSSQEDNGRQSFSEARDALAQWFAQNAPDRLEELKEILLPEIVAPSVETGNVIRIDGPLRLKRSHG